MLDNAPSPTVEDGITHSRRVAIIKAATPLFRIVGLPCAVLVHDLIDLGSAGLKQACPEGVFVSLTPGSPALWSAVLFVRDGPYAPAVLRFHIAFPDSYPTLPPLVTFSTDIFHPLITPLTTYMYTTDIQDNGTVSATDEERLPPGGFSLRHGFPQWFGRGKRGAAGGTSSTSSPSGPGSATAKLEPTSDTTQSYLQTKTKHISAYEVLRYIKCAFDHEEVLDAVPLDAAGNPGAWHAWRTHRKKLGKLKADKPPPVPVKPDKDSEATTGQNKRLPPQPRKPGEWNWEGVWEDRVKKGVQASLSEPALYGGASTADDLIQFLAMEQSEVDAAKEQIIGETV